MKEIAIIGAMCAGKTTLVKSFSSEQGVIAVEDGGRKYLTEYPESDRQSMATCLGITGEYNHLLTKAEESADMSTLAIVTDGSSLTPAAHLIAYDRFKEAEELLQIALPPARKIDMFFLLSIDAIPYETDEIRNEDTNFRERLQSAFRHILQKHTLPFQELSGTVQARKEAVEAFINMPPVS